MELIDIENYYFIMILIVCLVFKFDVIDEVIYKCEMLLCYS